MSYLDRDSSVEAIKNISSLFNDVTDVYEKYGININRDVGRKNILISAAQEHFFANAIASVVGECSNDGRTGMADIVIGSLDDREVECKVVCRGKTGSWSLQADKATLERKGSCDFLYLLFDRTHENTAVLLFENLVPDDFYDPAPGSRGKARLKKSSAFKKCKALVGGFENKRMKFLERYQDEVANSTTQSQKRKAEQKWTMWYNKEDSYSIQLESVDGLK
tara:strand:+ start:46 stop:711 length:666 start_codon:yes stop_codon:yes gene_type:complete